VIEDTYFSFDAWIEKRRRGRRKRASSRLWRRAFGLQIDEKACFSGLSPAVPWVAAANLGLRMRFQTVNSIPLQLSILAN
jgi:hypothetical protein